MKNEKRNSEVEHPASREEGNRYDKIFKENLRELAPSLAEKIIGLKDYWLEPLPQVKLQTTIEKEPDFLQIVHDARSPDGRLLQIEFEGQDEEITDWRMHEYSGIEGKIFKLKIEQHLIYYGEGEPKNIKGELEHTHYTYKYPVHAIQSISFQEFLHEEKPQVVIFAILADPGEVNPEDIIRMILERLVQLKGDSVELKKFIKQLAVLSAKRKLQAQTVKKVKEMMDYQDIQEDVFFIVGEEKGREEGREEGQTNQNIIAIRNMLAKGFDIHLISEILEVTQSYVSDIQAQLAKEPQIVSRLKKGDAASIIAEELGVLPLLVEVLKKEHDLPT